MAIADANGSAGTTGEGNEDDLGDLWASLFGQTFPASWGNVPSQGLPSLTLSPAQSNQPSPFSALPSPLADLGLTPPPPPAQRNPKDLSYLNHYLKVVLPMQYKLMGISVLMGDFVALSHCIIQKFSLVCHHSPPCILFHKERNIVIAFSLQILLSIPHPS